ncbi:hypothetical protein J6590_090141, partial [Homalodisca vitripennis]
NVSRVVEEKQGKQKFYARGSKTRILPINQTVLVRDYSRSQERWVEGCVVKQLGATMYLVRLASGIVYKRHVDQLIAVDTAPVTDQTAEVITAESQQTARSDCADDSPVGSNRTADAPRHSISVRPSTAMSPNASHTHTTYSSPITQRSPLARSTPVRRYPQRERKPITRLDL